MGSTCSSAGRCFILLTLASISAPGAVKGQTSLSAPETRFTIPAQHFVRIERGPLSLIIVDNHAIDIPDLPRHRAGYNGVASLSHTNRKENLFVPGIAGLNFEHIHDGTTAGLREKFEPRKSPMELRQIDEFTAELYQPPTENWQLESCGRYHLREDGVIEYTFECIPRADAYHRNFIGLFWASYIHQPSDKSIWFRGRRQGSDGPAQWLNASSPQHGVDSTHRSTTGPQMPPVESDFPLTLVNHPSRLTYDEPWYFGVSHGMAFLQVFRTSDNIWLAQSPSGGGNGNPAWDFQWFIEQPMVGQTYSFKMRAAYVPYRDRSQMRELARALRFESVDSE